jgi:two-component system, NarL family, invasion response regulator UvrY
VLTSVDSGRNEEATAVVDVLIVDDQPPFRAVARTVVSLVPGWRVVGEAATGEEAVEAARSGQPGVVLMDINLPGIDGIEATRRITADSPAVRVVLLSTYAYEDLPADALASGAVGYLHKEDLTPRVLRQLAP